VAHHSRAFSAERRDQAADVGAKVLERISLDAVGLVAAAIAAHIRRGYAIAGIGERRDLVTPRIPALGKAVDQNDQRASARHRHTKADAICLDHLQVRPHGASPLN
jgi:hypothetical protein